LKVDIRKPPRWLGCQLPSVKFHFASDMKSKPFTCVLALLIAAAPALADEDLDERAVIEARQSALRDIGSAFKSINDELKKSAPALAKIRERALKIEQLAQHQARWFPEGTGQDAGVINAAKDEIWERPDEFAAAQQAMAAEIGKLVQVANGTDVGAIKKQAQALGRTCKGCHDKFREED
jgi:cytochrome c556